MRSITGRCDIVSVSQKKCDLVSSLGGGYLMSKIELRLNFRWRLGCHRGLRCHQPVAVLVILICIYSTSRSPRFSSKADSTLDQQECRVAEPSGDVACRYLPPDSRALTFDMSHYGDNSIRWQSSYSV